jgi:putative membrane protein
VDHSPWAWDLGWAEIVVLAAAGLAYASALRRFPASRARTVCFAAALLVGAAALLSPLSTIAQHYLLSAHLVQNVALAEWAPLLAVIGIPPALAAALTANAPAHFLTHPLVALPLWTVSYFVWHVPAVYDAALRSHPLLQLEHACYMATGLLLWWPVVHDTPHDLPAGRRAAYVFAAFLLASPVAFFLSFLPEPVYGFYEEAPRIWDISPLADQQAAGVLMSVSEAVVFFAVFAFYLARFFVEEGG